MARTIRLGIVQLAATPNKDKNLKLITRYLEKHSDADLVVFPEYAMIVGEKGITRGLVNESKEPVDGPFMSRISRHTRDLGVNAIVNMIEDSGGRAYNTTVLSSSEGELVPVHRKTVLFDAYGYRESSIFEPGDLELTLVEIKGVRLGAVTCFEARFPELFRPLALRGAMGFIVPAGWYKGPGKEEQWVTTLKCRAHENTCYAIGVGNAAEQFIGRSIVVNPYGFVEVDLGYGEKSIEWELSEAIVASVREKLPLIDIVANKGLACSQAKVRVISVD